VNAAFTVNSDTQVTAIVPATAVTGKIAITTAGGIVTSVGNFTVAPAITSFTPSSGNVGTLVTLTGTTFKGATNVTFGGVPATFTVETSTQVAATVSSRGRHRKNPDHNSRGNRYERHEFHGHTLAAIRKV